MTHLFTSDDLAEVLPPIISGRPVSEYNCVVDFLNTAPELDELRMWFYERKLSNLAEIIIPVYERSHCLQ